MLNINVDIIYVTLTEFIQTKDAFFKPVSYISDRFLVVCLHK